ncbi:unnamed protein product, partial [marine sediment metagenome]
MNEECEKAVTGLGVRVRSPNEFVSILSGGERQAISIGRAMHFKVKLLILDEPLAALSVRETREVLRQVEKARESGVSVIFITHNVYHVYPVAERFVMLDRGVKIKYLIINETAENVPKINQGCQVLRLSNNLFKKVSDTVSPQGIIAVAEQIEISLTDIILDATPLVVVLNGLQDPGNLGTIIRTSAAAGATAVLLTEGTVDLYSPKVIRSTMGSLFQVPIINGLDDDEAVKWLNYNSINIIVADLDGEEYYYSANLKEPFALVI